MPQLIILLLEELFVDTVAVPLAERYRTSTMKDLEELFGDVIRSTQ
ncbi:hypothetical protein JOC70_000170 [Clostridium pascui]|nr:hypothetical protein [Clostridium pascui]MBM7868701.1 hypothetical protein [Clostridium pascui]